jgi:cell division protein FtsN
MKSTNNMVFFSYMYVYVGVVVHFVMGLVTMIHHKKYTCLQTIQFFHLCALHT